MTSEIDILNLRILLAGLASAGAGLLAGMMLVREWRSQTHQLFALGMLLFASQQGVVAMAAASVRLEHILGWTRMGLLFGAMAPAVWFFFILSLDAQRPARGDWKVWVGGATVVAPLIVTLFYWDWFFWGLPGEPVTGVQQIGLDRAGQILFLLVILGSTLMLAALERTLRASVGHTRWQLKFLLVGLGLIAGLRIYTASQYLLFSQLSSGLQLIDSAALLTAEGLIFLSLRRSKLLRFGMHPSQKLVTSSMMLLVVGIYLIGVGLVSGMFRRLPWVRAVPLDVLLIVLAVVVLAVLLLSDRFQHDLRRLGSRHLGRPSHDYRDAWIRFSERTARVSTVPDLAREVVGFVSERFEVLLVDLWIVQPSERQLKIVGSTATRGRELEHRLGERLPQSLIDKVVEMRAMIDLGASEDKQIKDQWSELRGVIHPRARSVVPLRTQEGALGFLALGERVRHQALAVEDIDLLQVLAQQTAASLLNLRLSEKLQEARQLEAFQKMSTFFVHDLKNLASRLSLTVQNLPTHFDNPEFRQDALETISGTLANIHEMIGRLSALKERIELRPGQVDLNDFLQSTIREIQKQVESPIQQRLAPLPPTMLDVEQFHKVVTNLLINAGEASPDNGPIEVSTESQNGAILVEIRDSGSGMSPEFIEQRLFRPFQTTKKGGVGIGLYHSKMIVEAHRGRMEVESHRGAGTTFRIILPLEEPS